MPSADDDFVPDFDNFDEQPQAVPTAVQAADSHDDPWGFNEPQLEQPPPQPTKKEGKKKKKAKKDAARKNKVEDGEDSSAYPKSITPSPPTDHGARLQEALPPAAHIPVSAQPVVPSSPLVNATFDDETTAVEDVDPLPPAPTKPSSKPSPAVSPVVRSPRPAPAKPAVTASPNSRPASLHGAPPRDQNNSLTGYRSSAPLSAAGQQRRESFASPRSRFDPPPPHMPQPHFFGLPDFGLNLGQKQEAGRQAGSDGYCCRIDSLADSGDELCAKKARDALFLGSEGGLEVLAILHNKLEVVGRLEGLRGSVIGAKILPHVDLYDDVKPLRPLVAVVVHGPMVDDRRDSGPEGEEPEPLENEPPSHFQTSVEVYSLQTQHYVSTLYRSTPVAIEKPLVGQVSSLPDPVGDLHVDAKGQFVTISSGKSGEVFVFTQAALQGIEATRFRCIGKFWTAVQKSLSAPTAKPANAGDASANLGESREEMQNPVCSLSQRWLAIAPPAASSNISIQGQATTSEYNPNPPGFTTHAAQAQPLVSCEVVGTDVEGAWSRLGRQAAQGLMKYSQRGIEMGLQGWKELTQPSPPGGRQTHDRSSSKEDLFPPTNAPSGDPSRLAKEPAIVSIIDLDNLLYHEEHKPKHALIPLATFALVDGCNFLSFSSAGTRLLTVSRKGEISTIWDLQQVAHGIPKRGNSDFQDNSTSPCVKQLQRITRNSPSTVLGCAWSRDDDAVAILTAHGTVHLHEVPSRPPPRKRKRSSLAAPQSAEKADATVSLSTGLSPPSANQGFLGSIKSGWQTVSTQVNSMRTTNPASSFGLPTTFAGFKEATAAASNAGSRAVARGISQGYTAAKGGASDYWHADDNKIRHTKALQEPFSAKSLRWIRRSNTVSVAIACGGTVHVHPVQRVTRRKGDEIVSGLKHEKYAHKAFPLPPIHTRHEAGGLQGLITDTCTGIGPHGFWSLRQQSLSVRPEVRVPKMLHNQASDVETNPPYCPFHVDASVSIFAFDEYDETALARFEAFALKGHGILSQAEESSWTFGDALPSQFKMNERVPSELPEEDEDFLIGEPTEQGMGDGDEDEDVADQMESKLTIQPARKNRAGQEEIRINTRPAKKRGKGGGGGGGQGFDMLGEDDEVGSMI